jgi:hypothetical protein
MIVMIAIAVALTQPTFPTSQPSRDRAHAHARVDQRHAARVEARADRREDLT